MAKATFEHEGLAMKPADLSAFLANACFYHDAGEWPVLIDGKDVSRLKVVNRKATLLHRLSTNAVHTVNEVEAFLRSATQPPYERTKREDVVVDITGQKPASIVKASVEDGYILLRTSE